MTGSTRATAFAASVVAGLAVALVAVALLALGRGVDVAAADHDGDVDAVESTTEEFPHLRVHLTVPLHLVPGHVQTVAVAVSEGDGTPKDPDDDLVLSATLHPTSDDDGDVVLLGESTWSITVGGLAQAPIRVLALGDPSCDAPIAELTIRVRPVDAEAVEVTRTLHGPPCDGPEVVAAPESVNLDVPVPYGPDWRTVVAQLLDPTLAPAPRSQPAPSRAAPAPTRPRAPAPTERPTEEPSEDPAPPEPAPEPEPEPEPKPEPTPSPTEPEPTEPPKPEKPKPVPKPEPPPPVDGSGEG
jgi:hypothetical protein